MWHEARKQERMIRGMIVDYRRRAERRKDFYEKIKAEPTQFLQLHGRPCKIHLDAAIAAAGEGPAIMMPWQGDSNNMIDRFDVRAHLDFIPEVKFPDIPPDELSPEERQCNYERYRILAQNVFLGISEDKFLQQLAIEEQFGVTIEEKESQKEKLNEKRGGAAIQYNYNDPGAQPTCSNGRFSITTNCLLKGLQGPETKKVEQKDSDDDSDFEIIDVDLSIDVNKMEALQAHELNAVGPQFGMAGCDLFSFLTGDADDAEHQKQLLREEKEKAMFSGRKSRRERRAHRDKKLASRVVSPPSYAAPSTERTRSPVVRSPSRTPSPDNAESIQFITSFGGDEEDAAQPPKPLYSDKVKQSLKKLQYSYSDAVRRPKPRSVSPPKYSRPIGPQRLNSRSRSISRSRSRSRSRSSRSKSRSRSRSWRRSRSKSRSYSRSRSSSSRSRSRSYSSYRSRSRSRSRNYRNRRSRSPVNRHSGHTKYNDSRSISFDSSEKAESSKPVARYYGRRKEDRSSSELSVDSQSSDESETPKNNSAVGNKSNTNQNQLRLSGSSSKGPSRETLSLKEKLKRKMQAQLSRQLRADKRAEAERLERESRRQARRDEEMRELAIKLRRKQREMRHQQYRRSSDDDSDRSRSRSSSRESLPPGIDSLERSRSKSKSPDKRVPVWEPNREPNHYYRTKPDNNPDTKKKYTEEHQEKNVERQSHQRYDKHPNFTQSRDGPRNYERNVESYNRLESDNRYESNKGDTRRPLRGGYRGTRHGPEESHGGPSWRDQSSKDGESYTKVKLVDY